MFDGVVVLYIDVEKTIYYDVFFMVKLQVRSLNKYVFIRSLNVFFFLNIGSWTFKSV